jgi:hypothetical protein
METIITTFRSIFRGPMGAFDTYSNMRYKHPKTHNFFLFYGIAAFILVAGKGMEKFTFFESKASAYEAKRRAARYYIPYFIRGYHYKFPV